MEDLAVGPRATYRPCTRLWCGCRCSTLPRGGPCGARRLASPSHHHLLLWEVQEDRRTAGGWCRVPVRGHGGQSSHPPLEGMGGHGGSQDMPRDMPALVCASVRGWCAAASARGRQPDTGALPASTRVSGVVDGSGLFARVREPDRHGPVAMRAPVVWSGCGHGWAHPSDGATHPSPGAGRLLWLPHQAPRMSGTVLEASTEVSVFSAGSRRPTPVRGVQAVHSGSVRRFGVRAYRCARGVVVSALGYRVPMRWTSHLPASLRSCRAYACR